MSGRYSCDVDQLASALDVELESSWVNGGVAFANAVFENHVSDVALEDFIDGCVYYGSHKWILPTNPIFGTDLYKPFADVITAILQHFNRAGVRKAVDSFPSFKTVMKTIPDISLLGSGPSFSCDQSLPLEHTWAHCAGSIGIIRSSDLALIDSRPQMAVYARQCFVEQNNRRFVYTLLLTESCAQIFKFDRAGGMYSSWINIHTHPKVFVRFILGMSSLDENELGFETRIYWNNGHRFFKPNLDGNIVYRIVNPDCPFHRRTIKSRGTVCWRVEDGRREFILKFSWRTIDRVPEWQFLEYIKEKHIEGVGGIESYADLGRISDHRYGVALQSDRPRPGSDGYISDRIYYFVLQPYHGPVLGEFRTELELLTAFRDAIAGHMHLLSIGVLHRDISFANILINRSSDAVPGNRGLVIDFDMAVLLEEGTLGFKTDFTGGTPNFRSIKLHKRSGIHDYLDDLESYFYVFCWMCLRHSGPGIKLERLPDAIADWGSPDAKYASSAKYSLLMAQTVEIGDGFSMQLQDVFDKLRHFFRNKVLPRLEALDPDMRERLSQTQPSLNADKTASTSHVSSIGCNAWLTEQAKADYMTILGLLDDAIESITGEKLNILIHTTRPAYASGSSGPAAKRVKRS